MIYFITLMMSASITIMLMMLFLIIVARKEQYAHTWIYGLIKLGVILLTVPLMVLTLLLLYSILKREILPIGEDQPSVILIYREKYSILKRFYSYRPYVWIIFYGWLAGIAATLVKLGIDVFRFYKNIIIGSKRVTDETVLHTVNRVKQDLSIKKPVFVCYNEAVTSPMLIMDEYIQPGDCAAICVNSDSSFLRVFVSGEFETDFFKVSVNGKSVNSSYGMVSHRFSVSANKTYCVYIDNTSDEEIHITGSIYS